MITEVIAWACIAAGLFGAIQSGTRLARSIGPRGKAWQMLGISLVTTSIGGLLLSGSHAAMITAIVFVICQIILLLIPKRRNARTGA